MGDENRLVRGVDCRLLHVVDERLDCLATAARFFHGNKAAFVVDVHHGFDIEQRARPCARAAHASAAEQEHQIVDGEPVAQVVARFAHEISDFFKRRARFLFLAGQIYEHAFAARCRERFDGAERALGIFPGELFHQQLCGFIGA